MKKNRTLILLVLVFAVVLAGAYVLYSTLGDQVQLGGLAVQVPTEPSTEPQQVEVTEGTTGETVPDTTEVSDYSAPDFTVVDSNGTEVKLSDFEGKPVVLNFWASWCGPCKSEMPDFQKAYETYGEEIHFLMVNLTDGSQETVETASKFIASQGYTFPVYFDTSYSAAITYAVNAVPVTYFIDANGDLIAYGQGALDAATLQKGIDMIYTLAETE